MNEPTTAGRDVRSILRALVDVLGVLLVAVGFALAWLPLGLIALGVGLLTLSYVLDEDDDEAEGPTP